MDKALTRLGRLLRERRVAGEIAVFGGAAIVLGFDFRSATQDVDAMITQGHGQVVKAQQEVGDDLGLPPNWLNEQGTSYLSRQVLPEKVAEIRSIARRINAPDKP